MKKISPKCANGDIAMITNESRWMPCCNFSSGVAKKVHRVEIFESDEFLVSNQDSVDNFHRLESFKSWIDSIENDYDSAPAICKINCGVREAREGLNIYNHKVFMIKNASDLIDFLDEINEKADG